MTSRLEQAEHECTHLTGKLRKALLAVQTMRIEGALAADVTDVRAEVDYLLKTGRVRTARSLLDLVENVSTAKINLAYLREPESRDYDAVVESVADGKAPSYLKEGS
jgi:hypothetical protein